MYDVVLAEEPSEDPPPGSADDFAQVRLPDAGHGVLVVGSLPAQQKRTTMELCHQRGRRLIQAPHSWAATMADFSVSVGTAIIADIIVFALLEQINVTNVIGTSAFGSLWGVFVALAAQLPAIGLFR
jgi:hypothetical protein